MAADAWRIENLAEERAATRAQLLNIVTDVAELKRDLRTIVQILAPLAAVALVVALIALIIAIIALSLAMRVSAAPFDLPPASLAATIPHIPWWRIVAIRHL